MTYLNINDLTSPLICSSSNRPIISCSAYIRNKLDNFYRYYLERYLEGHLYDGYGLLNDKLLNDKYEYSSEINNYKFKISSATYNRIEVITNKYFADKRIYVPGIAPKSYYYPSRGNSKSIRELCYFIKSISDLEKNRFSYNPYSTEYTVQNYKFDMENLYKRIISQKILNSYTTQNNSTKQRNNNQEEMSCFRLIADRNNTNKKFHK